LQYRITKDFNFRGFTIKRAFSLIELIFVIVVLGIVASIGSEIIAKAYENFIASRVHNETQARVNHAVDLIAKRVSNHIPQTIIAHNINNNADFLELNEITLATRDNYRILEWYGKSYSSFLGAYDSGVNIPGWSGLIDLRDSSETNISTPGSALNEADTIIKSLTSEDVNLSGCNPTNRCPVIIFKGFNENDVSNYGYGVAYQGATDHNYSFTVDRNNTTNRLFFQDSATATLFDTSNPIIYLHEQYDLVHSAYALVPSGDCSTFFNDCDLNLSYNYQPWYGETYFNASSVTILENLSLFRFSKLDGVITIELCAHDENNVSHCRQKAIF